VKIAIYGWTLSIDLTKRWASDIPKKKKGIFHISDGCSIMLDDNDRRIIGHIQGDIPLSRTPFLDLAETAGMDEGDVIARIKRLKDEGIIRRFGATLRHQEAGFSANAMVAWRVPDERITEVGERLAGFREVTHCYQRVMHQKWPYNLYTMLHGKSEEQCRQLAGKMSRAVGIDNYILLFSTEEFKKTSMEYF